MCKKMDVKCEYKYLVAKNVYGKMRHAYLTFCWTNSQRDACYGYFLAIIIVPERFIEMYKKMDAVSELVL